jgi:UDPglucose 6-dehydrogenase
MVKIAVVGTGYVGLVSGTCLAESGHVVVCSDISKEKIEMLNRGEVPIYEMGLKELIEKNVEEERLFFTTNVAQAIQDADVVFSAVGTPPDENHKADLKFVKAVAKTFAENLNGYKVFVNKSTVPVGTGALVKEIIQKEGAKDFDVVSNPEFLREGAAVKDFLNPDRIIIGVESEKAKEIMGKIYAPFERNQSPIMFTDLKSAELIKYASNSFLAMKISFINQVAGFCEKVGADVKQVAKGMGYDNRIGSRFLQAGIGYGGSCFPKDVDALIESGIETGHPFTILEEVRRVNKGLRTYSVEKISKALKNNLSGKKIAVWGLSFKPRTDDVREAPAVEIIQGLLEKGAKISAFDPEAMENFKHFNPELEIEYVKRSHEALKDADLLFLCTEWDEFRVPDFKKMQSLMKGKIIVDGRNIFKPEEVHKAGFEYYGFGRS